MSVIVAVKKDGKTVMAADSQSNFGSQKFSDDNLSDMKILRHNKSLIGFSGWTLYDNILKDFLSKKANGSLRLNTTASVYSVFRKFYSALSKDYAFNDEHNRSKEDSSPFADLDTNFLIANKSSIFLISDDLCVSSFNQFYAVGSGSEYALGALYTLYSKDLDANQIAYEAVEAASHYDIYCGGKTTVLSV